MKRPGVGDEAPPIELPVHGAAESVGRWSLAERRGCTVVVIFHRHIH